MARKIKMKMMMFFVFQLSAVQFLAARACR